MRVRPEVLDRPWVRGAALLGHLVVLILLAVHVVGQHPAWHGFDTRVYAVGARAVLEGAPLAEARFEGYPFTYPPFAALMLLPTALVPGSVLLLLGCGSAQAALVAATGAALRAAGSVSPWWRGAVLSLALAALYPSATSIVLGQVDHLVLALVLADLALLRGRRWHGALVGVAVAIKLTPAVFLLWFLVRRDWRGLGVAAGTAVAATAMAGLALPSDSVDFWLGTLWDTSRVGLVTAPLNLSLAATAGRVLSPGSPTLAGSATVLWVGGCLISVALAAVAARRLERSGRVLSAWCAVGLAGLLVSPVSWSHHWVWIVPTLIAAWTEWPGVAARLLTALGAALLCVPTHWVTGSVAGTWPWWATLYGALPALWVLALISLASWSTTRHTRRHHTPGRPHPAPAA